METFIIVYMITNEIVGVVCAGWYINYLKETGYFEQRKIDKWLKEHDAHFYKVINKIDKILTEADKENKEIIFIDDYWEDTCCEINFFDINVCLDNTYDPLFIRDYKRKVWDTMLNNHKCKLDYKAYFDWH